MIICDIPQCTELDRQAASLVYGGDPTINIDGSWLMASPVIAVNVETSQVLIQHFDTIGSHNSILGGYFELGLLNQVAQTQSVSVPVPSV